MASLLSNQAASTVENSINVEIETSEITENPETELETSLEPKPSAWKESLVQQETAFFWHRRILQAVFRIHIILIWIRIPILILIRIRGNF